MLQTPESVTALLLSPKRTSDIDPLQASIESDHEELMVISDKQLAENARKLLDRVNQLFDVVRWTSVSVAALLIAIVMFVSVLERTRELGTLRAIGAPRKSFAVAHHVRVGWFRLWRDRWLACRCLGW